MTQCDPTLIYRYWNNKELYTGEPYNCIPPSIPTISGIYDVSEQRNQRTEVTESNTAVSSLMDYMLLWILLQQMVLWLCSFFHVHIT